MCFIQLYLNFLPHYNIFVSASYTLLFIINTKTYHKLVHSQFPRRARNRKRFSTSACASATVAHSSTSLLRLTPRARAKRFKRSCLDSGNRMVSVDMMLLLQCFQPGAGRLHLRYREIAIVHRKNHGG